MTESRDETELQVMLDPGKDIRPHKPSPDMSVEQLVGCVETMFADIGAVRKATAVHYWWAGETLRMIRRKLAIKHGDWKKHVVESLKLSWSMVRTSQRIRKRHDNPEKCTGKTLRQAEAYRPRPSQEKEKTHSDAPEVTSIPPAPAGGDIATPPQEATTDKPKRRHVVTPLEPEEHQRRLTATTLIHGDCLDILSNVPQHTADLTLFSPPYPEIQRPYGRMTEKEWHQFLMEVMARCRYITKPSGSIVVLIQPNKEKVGKMRLWPWEFVCWAGATWGLVQDQYVFNPSSIPCAGADRRGRLMRQSVMWSVWLGDSDCYRNQDAVLREPADETARRVRSDVRNGDYPGSHHMNGHTFARALAERGGVTPYNMLSVPTGTPIDQHGHPAVTPFRLAEWWCRYVLPPGGVLVDPFCGSGTTLVAALDCGASRVIGIDKDAGYLEKARCRILHEAPHHELT
ncbi:MAG: DNA methyltransferase [Pirellulaceae bacterium]